MNEVNTGGSVNAIASDCSSREGGQSEGNPSVQAGTALKQLRKVVEKRLAGIVVPDLTLENCIAAGDALGQRYTCQAILIDIDEAIAKAEGEFSRRELGGAGLNNLV